MRLCVWIVLTLVLLGGVCHAQEVMLLYSGETRGALWPCDCRVPGGVVKRATVDRQLRQAGVSVGAAVVSLDLGHLASGPLDSTEEPVGLWPALAALRLDACVLGPDDLPASESRVVDLQSRIGAPILVSTPDPQQSWPMAMVEREGVRVAVLGWPLERIRSPGDLAPLTLQALLARDQSDFVVLLSPLQDTLLRPALREVPGIDAVICRSDPNRTTPSPELEEDRIWGLLHEAGEVGCLWVRLGEPHEVAAFSSSTTLLLADVEEDPDMVAIALGEGEETPTAATPRPASLEIEASGLTWDEVAEGTVIEAEVRLINEGDEPLPVRNVRSTCRCVHVGEHPEVIEGGQRMTIPVSIVTAGRAGQFSEALIITTRERSRPVRTVAVGGLVVASPEATVPGP